MATDDDDERPTEERLLAATGRVLERNGIEGLTTARVAEECGKSQSLVHYYYETKEDLVVAYIEYLRQQNRESYRRNAGKPPLERLEGFFDVTADARASNPERSNVQFELHAAAGHNERYREALNGVEDDAREFVRNAIEDGIDEGVFREVDVEATVTFVLAAHDGGVLRTGPLRRTGDAAALDRGFGTYVVSALTGPERRDDVSPGRDRR